MISDLLKLHTGRRENGKVELSNKGIVYLSAEEEEDRIIAQANAPLNEDGNFVNPKVKARYEADYPTGRGE